MFLFEKCCRINEAKVTNAKPVWINQCYCYFNLSIIRFYYNRDLVRLNVKLQYTAMYDLQKKSLVYWHFRFKRQFSAVVLYVNTFIFGAIIYFRLSVSLMFWPLRFSEHISFFFLVRIWTKNSFFSGNSHFQRVKWKITYNLPLILPIYQAINNIISCVSGTFSNKSQQTTNHWKTKR